MSPKEYIVPQWERVNCPVCNSDESTFYERFGYRFKFTYVRCLNCKSAYQNPRPVYNEEFIKEAYDHYADGRWFYNEPDYYEKNAVQFDREIAEIIEYDSNQSSILDVGPGVGLFLFSAKKVYPKCVGLEVSKNLAEVTQEKLNVPVYSEDFLAFESSEKFSCINISHVIEHVPNPNEWLAKAKSLLIPSGLLVVDVPNWFSWSQRLKLFFKRIGIRRSEWPPEKMPEHLYEPGIPGMKFLFKKNGFKILKYYTYSRSDLTSIRFPQSVFHKFFKAGSNLRFYVKVK